MIKLVSRSLLLFLPVANHHLFLLFMVQNLLILGPHFHPSPIVMLLTVITAFLYSITNIYLCSQFSHQIISHLILTTSIPGEFIVPCSYKPQEVANTVSFILFVYMFSPPLLIKLQMQLVPTSRLWFSSISSDPRAVSDMHALSIQ